MNYFIIGGDKKEYGPASTEQVQQWLREGRANSETLLRLDGDTTWKPLRAFEEFQADLPPSQTNANSQSLETPVAANVPIGVGHAFGRAWHLVAEHFGTILGATFLTWMALTALALTGLGILLLPILEGPLYAGLFLVFLKIIRTGEASASDIFSFSRTNAFSLMIASLLITILSSIGLFLCVIPGIYLKVAWLLAFPLIADRGVGFWEGMEISRQTISPRWFPFCALFVIAFLPLFVFEIYMRIHIGTEAAPAISHLLATGNLQAFLAELKEVAVRNGWLPIVGQLMLLVTLPLGMGSFAFVYEDLFGRKR